MIFWLTIVSVVYAAALVGLSYKSNRKNANSGVEYVDAGGNLGALLGFFTFSATLFSTFTLMGMPNFFRTHGVGAWIFLGVTDVSLAFVSLWFGLRFRAYLRTHEFRSVSQLLNHAYGSTLAKWVYLVTVFLFLLPYVAIQIRGVSVFLEALTPNGPGLAFWSVLILVVIVFYSGYGGLRAIIYSDALQGTVLLIASWIIAMTCFRFFDYSPGEMFRQVSTVDEALLSNPGPAGLFTVQFLVSSFLAITLMPITQPQLTARIAYLKSDRELRKMAVAVGVFTILVVMPAIVIGAYGSVHMQGATPAEFWTQVIVTNQAPAIASVAIIGLLAAAMSTADSQIFALSSEFGSAVPSGQKAKKSGVVKVVMLVFAAAALVLSLVSTNELVLLARVSFAGTSFLAPMILVAITGKARPGPVIPAVTLVAVVLFALSLFGMFPSSIGGFRTDLALLIATALAVALCYFLAERQGRNANV